VFPTSATMGNTNLLLFPQAGRDLTNPDIGYHYEPMDYVFGNDFFTNSTITITNGAAVGVFAGSSHAYGIGLDDSANLFSDGSPTALNRIVRANVVQEFANTNWSAPLDQCISVWTTPLNPPQAHFRFTEWSVPAQDSQHFYGSEGVDFPVDFR